MLRFYFHLRDGEQFEEDIDGIELPDVDSARTEAVVAAREILFEHIALGVPVGGQVFEVCDEEGVMFFNMPLRNILHS
ncbi:DUF6894 family protein [Pararhizobium sp. PWRC1-1]|uniref:DUF6894 family protein n=1 Tax=Pararhizobium sp. PWRC1-1 TaxID=2804566 RepID=UPI003CF6FAA0